MVGVDVVHCLPSGEIVGYCFWYNSMKDHEVLVKQLNGRCIVFDHFTSLFQLPKWDHRYIHDMGRYPSHLLGNDRIRSLNPRLPPVRGGNMLIKRPLLARRGIEILSVRAVLHRVVVPENATLPELGEEQLDDIDKGAGLDGVGLV